MSTVKQLLAEKKRVAQKIAVEAKKITKRRSKYEAEQLHETVITVLDALEGFTATLHKDNSITVNIGRKRINISIRYELREVQYCDEMRPEMKRCLEIGIGYYTNEPMVGTSVEGFTEAFARFLKTERLV